ncbi:unnamed protein product [Symbiodinium natans]|uniref:Uncharacterized protein n=1 Tax=Symbiodinium natans TaxID=878477 RepID=A0A812KZD5_9DINO|nr:unnamed protein product [Symbiodinium natans]
MKGALQESRNLGRGRGQVRNRVPQGHAGDPTDGWKQDLHMPFSSYCGTSGALSSLDFGQLFAGDAGSQTTCKFAPLIQFGSFVDTGIVRWKTTTNWPDWHHLLAENYVECASGEALTAFKLDAAKNIYKYECSKIGGLGACFDYYSAQVEIASFLISGYQCCKAGGAPVSFELLGHISKEQGKRGYDGIYCPSGRDSHSGRVQFAPFLESRAVVNEPEEDRQPTCQWCVESECSEVTDSESPLGMQGFRRGFLMVGCAAFEVVNVSDFNGEFNGQMPKEEKKAERFARGCLYNCVKVSLENCAVMWN